MTTLQQELTADEVAKAAIAHLQRQAEEIEQLEAIVERLKAERNNARLTAQMNKETAARIGEQLDEACKRTEYWRGRCLAAEMQEHESKWWEG